MEWEGGERQHRDCRSNVGEFHGNFLEVTSRRQAAGSRSPLIGRSAGALPWPGTETTLLANTSAPEVKAPANIRPQEVASVCIVMSAPGEHVAVPLGIGADRRRGARLPEHVRALAPLVSKMRTWAAGEPGFAVIELPAWKTNIAFWSPLPVQRDVTGDDDGRARV
jgi:hypothetical protein